MNRKYIVAIVIAVFILIINQVFIQYFLHEKRYDAKTINLAGKQRMLSQKINVEFYKILKDNQSATLLPSLVKEWKDTHHNLLDKADEMKLSPITHPEALQLMDNLSSRIDFVEKQLNQLLSNHTIDIASINKNQIIFLEEMNQVVTLLEKTSSNKLQSIIYIEIFLMIISILIIVLEVIFIFHPIHQKLAQSLDETKKAKAMLEENMTELKRKNQDLEQFAYVASHDLQEPLRTIISFTQLLHRKYRKQFEQDGKEEMTFIIDATRRMKSLISGLLEYTRIGRTKGVKPIDCNDLVLTVQEDLSIILAEKNAKLNVEPLPKLMIYETEVRQLFQNLITNALKFQKEAIQPEIVISGVDLQDKYQFSIQDNGIGIAEEYQEQIFSIFKRLHTVDQYEGTGIGLAQCKKIVELHNGQIWVDSKENVGSVFHFTISYSLS